MTPLQIRRATVDDREPLKAIWLSMRLPADELESRLTEFQIVEREGEITGAIGFAILRTAGRLHSEGYSDFSVADKARELFWERIQALAANHGVFRLWTQEDSPFWRNWGFQPADAEALERLPEEWKSLEGKWLTLELKNEAVITAMFEKQSATLRNVEKQQNDEVVARVKTFTNFFAVIFFLIGFAGIAFAIFLFMRYHTGSR
jgi:N-acetylglutamate synthase-like GNAT family acetyltransferase